MTISETTQPITCALLVYTAYSSRRNGKVIEDVQHATNSMKDQLVTAAKAAGKSEQRDDDRSAVAALAAKGPQEVIVKQPKTEPIPTEVIKK